MTIGWSRLKGPPRLLMTGATGFIGSFLVESFLRRRCCVHCIARASARGEASPLSRVTLAIRAVNPGAPISRLSALAGDITRPLAGLPESALDILRGQIDEIWHCAAESIFDPALGERIFHTNLDGTANMVDLAEAIECPSFCFISTAYVSDQTRALATEEPVRDRKSFRNPYEESKLGAENRLLERSAKSGFAATIFRLPVVAGHSVTGQTGQFLGYYYYAKHFLDLRAKLLEGSVDGSLVSQQIRFAPAKLELPIQPQGYLELPVRIFCEPEATVNILPVDLVVATLNRCADAKRGGTLILHLTNGTPPQTRFLFEETLRLLGLRGFRIESPGERDSATPGAPPDPGNVLASLEESIYSASLPYLPYTIRETTFARKNLKDLIGPDRLPDFEVDPSYLRKILEYAVSIWGAKKP
ncbi:MAG: SDR family oxidoreductase [Acidobacteriota bacterium]